MIKKNLPHIVAIVTFLLVCTAYFIPQTKGYRLKQHDIEMHKAQSKEIVDFREMYDKEPLWTNSTFGGMPAYQISTNTQNIINSSKNLILMIFPRPIGYIFIMMLGFYILLMCLKVDPWIALIGSVVFGLASVNMLYLAGGHNAKIHAISFIAPVIGGIYLAYRRKLLLGAALTGLFVCLQVSANHIQMTYYMLFLIFAIALVEFYRHFKEKALSKFVKTSSVLLIAGILGILPTISNLMITKEYGEYSTRGESELTISPNSNPLNDDLGAGLDKDYIKVYSFGFGEVWSLVFPNVKGGSSGQLASHPDALNKVKPALKSTLAQYPSYWGEQSFSGGAFYFGAIVFMLFVMFMFFVQDRLKWALLGVTILAIMLSWKYGALVDFFIDYFPLFNKFRDTKMMLILVQIAFPLGAILFLQKFKKENIDLKKFYMVSGSILGVLILFYIAPTTFFEFFSRQDQNQFAQMTQQYGGNQQALNQISDMQIELEQARIHIFKSDLGRSILLIALSCGILFLGIKKMLKPVVVISAFGVLMFLDIWSVDKRYLNNDQQRGSYKSWIMKAEYSSPFTATAADLGILSSEVQKNPSLMNKIETIKQSENWSDYAGAKRKIREESLTFRTLNYQTNYRVFSLANPFSSARASYFHKSIGGYHGAKLGIFQELVDFHLSSEQQQIVQLLQSGPTYAAIDSLFKEQTPVLNMLNTKYIIANPQGAPIENPYNWGNAWLVEDVEIVDNADKEILSLKKITPSKAVIQKKFAADMQTKYLIDSLARIEMTEYLPNQIKYDFSSQNNQYAVFSEIHYPEGWNAYIDGSIVPHQKVNYVLRGLSIPAGKHEVVFKFEPTSYKVGRTLSHAGSVLLIILLLGALFIEYKQRKEA